MNDCARSSALSYREEDIVDSKSRKGDFFAEKLVSHLAPGDSDFAEGLAVGSPGREVEHKGKSKQAVGINGSSLVLQVDVNAVDDANINGHKFGRGKRGRKRKNLEIPDKDHDSDVLCDEAERDSPSKSDDKDANKDSADSSCSRRADEKVNMNELVEADNCGGHTDSNDDSRTGEIKKGQRGRKKKKVENRASEKSLDGTTRTNSASENMVDVVQSRGILSRKRKEANGPASYLINAEVDENPLLAVHPRKKIKGRGRGRPPKNGGAKLVHKVAHNEKDSVMPFKKFNGHPKQKNLVQGGHLLKVQRKNGPLNVMNGSKGNVSVINKNVNQSRVEQTGKASKYVQEGSTVIAVDEKQLKTSNPEKGGEIGRREEQQFVREQIISMLLKAGWTVEHRPRQSREYVDAVYVDLQGKTHWSVTLAYEKLKEKVENGEADENTISVFTPIPEELLSKLFRVRKDRKQKVKQIKQHGSKPHKGATRKKSSRTKPVATKLGNSKYKEKHSYDTISGVKSSKKRKRGDASQAGHSRKPCALLVRSSEEAFDSESDGFISCNGKCSLLSWMIDSGTIIPNGKVKCKNGRKRKVMLEGTITRDGIQCSCCDKIFTVSEFHSHAGIKLSQPFEDICIESGISLHQCLLDSWNKQESENLHSYIVDVDDDDPNDDTCNICGDGGDLVCCDGCPSTFHQSCLGMHKFPSGAWHCVYCSCKVCGTIDGKTQRNYNRDTMVSDLLVCRMCEQKFHKSCLQLKDAVAADSRCLLFCGMKCEKLFERLQVLLGVKHEMENGFSWTLLRCSKETSGASQKVECNAKLAVAFSIMDECFLPIIDQRSGVNLIQNVVYSRGSNFNRLNYSGFLTVILERGDEIISAACIRIHGEQLAEMPFVGTRYMYRRQGMCRQLLIAIESALSSLAVEKLVIPAVTELLQTWTIAFGFKPLEKSKRNELRHMSMVVFPFTDMLQKPVRKLRASEITQIPPSDELQHKTEGADNSDVGCSFGSDSNSSGEVVGQQIHDCNDETVGLESSLPLSDSSFNDASTATNIVVNGHELVVSEHIAHPVVPLNSKGPATENAEPDEPSACVEWNRCQNAESGSINLVSNIASPGPNQQSTSRGNCKVFNASQIESDGIKSDGTAVLALEEEKEAIDSGHGVEPLKNGYSAIESGYSSVDGDCLPKVPRCSKSSEQSEFDLKASATQAPAVV